MKNSEDDTSGQITEGERREEDLLLFLVFMALFLATLCLDGCALSAPSALKKGDRVKVHYTCRMPDGKVAVTTDEAIARDNAVLARDVFLPFKAYGPEEMVAGELRPNRNGAFELDVANGIVGAVVGMSPGEARTLTLKGRYLDTLPESERYTVLPRVRHREKERTVNIKQVSKHLGHDPSVGEKALSYEGVDGFVKSIDGDKAFIRLDVKEGTTVHTPFGEGVIRDRGETYDIEIDAKIGHVVRSHTIVGRIVAVGPDTFTIDYGHTLGGEELTCDVKVEPGDAASLKEGN